MFIKTLKKLLGIHSPSPNKEFAHVMYKYHEEDTKCDLCPYNNECDLIEITTLRDTRRHFINNIGSVCRLKGE